MTIADAVLTAPEATSGTPTGDGDWRLTVEAWLPADPMSVVGAAVVDTDIVSEDVWTDLSDYLTGVDVKDGQSVWGDHRRPSMANITLNSPGHRFAAWGPLGAPGSGHRFRPGCPIRVVLHDPVAAEWHPLFTGEIESCVEKSAGVDALIVAEIVAIDTVSSRLSKSQLVDYVINPDDDDEYPIASVVSDLVAYARWPYGTVLDIPYDDAGDPYPIIGRMYLAGTVLEQLRRVADTIGRTVSADRYGRMAFVRRSPQIVTYSNTYTPATDPNAPDPVTIDTADAIADTVHPVADEAGIINAVEITKLWRNGIYGPASVDPDTDVAPQRRISGQLATVARGLQFASTQAPASYYIQADGHVGWKTATAEDGVSVARYGLRKIAITDMFPIFYGEFTGLQIADNLVDLYADDLWAVPLELDNRQIDMIAAARVGAATEVVHGDATFTGHLSSIRVRSTPMQGRCKIVAEILVHANTLERGTV